ncbi:MAG: GNAT family N-acetyltransferase [Tissierellia bacterium]|nr:GNAT family N-acetyltransferase [Tissierellia bacterium]
MKKDIEYICKLTSEITITEKKDFVNLFNEVFHTDYGLDWFDWKYMDNIYGDSYIVFAYHGDRIVGIRSFWRNDIDGHLSYQPCDTAVHKDYRGQGIFSNMSLVALEKVKGAFIYNFPNENSLPGNLKLGWRINKYSYLKLVIDRNRLRRETKFIEPDYLIWRFGKSPINKYYYCQIGGDFYLLFKRKNNIYYVLGRFDKEYKDYFIKAHSPILFNYTHNKTFTYRIFKNRSTLVSYQKEGYNMEKIDVPMFKADFF